MWLNNARLSLFVAILALCSCGGRGASPSQTSASSSSSTSSPATKPSASIPVVHPEVVSATSNPPVVAQAPVSTQAVATSTLVTRPGRSNRPISGAVSVVVDVLQNRHSISPLIYGVNFPPSTSYIADSGSTLVRWGGNASSRYNWQNFDTNAGSDWYFSNRPMDTNPLYQDSLNFVSTIAGAGASPIMTIGLLPWVAKDDSSASFSVVKYGAQCATNPFNSDQGNGVKADCSTNITGNDPNDAHVPLLDIPDAGDPGNAVYRNAWVTALSTNFGTAPHFYNMDNEMDIWAGTHRDVHPDAVNYHELRGTFLKEAKLIKAWDPNAILFGPVSCCWWFYWNSAAGGTDKDSYAGIDLLPWWLNEVAISDRVDNFHSLDVFDIHAYTDSPDTSGYTLAQKQALTLRITRDWWDPKYTSESNTINQNWATQMQPRKTVPFRIPRMRAMLNSIYPGTPLAMTEWNEGLAVWGSSAGDADFATALADVDAYGILGRERVYAASRWTAPSSDAPAYQALKLFRNYDGAHHTFGSTSVSATNSGNPDFFSSYASVDATGTTLTVILINKDPQQTVPVQVALPNFSATSATTYTLSSSDPTHIVASGPESMTQFWDVAPYSAMLLVITGLSNQPSFEWDMNPDTIMVPANGTVDLHPRFVSGTGAFAITNIQSDAGISLNASQPNITDVQTGTVNVTAGATPGFYHYSVSGIDGAGLQQTQGGWIVVGNPAATLSKIGDNQVAPAGSILTVSVTLAPGQSGGTGSGASILFTADAGSLPNRIVLTSNTSQASTQITLPSTPGVVHVTAEGPIPLGHPVATFTLTAQ